MAESNPTQATKSVPIRALMINVVFSIFISIVVFSIASFGILVPHMYEQKNQIDVMTAKVIELEQRLSAAEAAVAATQAPAAPTAAAEAPAAPAAAAEAPAAPAAAPAATAAETP